MYSRRKFFRAAGGSAAAAMAVTLKPGAVPHMLRRIAHETAPPRETARDETFWLNVQQAFSVDRSLINLNSGGVSPSPRIVQEAMKGHLDYSNEAPVYTMWRILEPQREGVRQRIARAFGCDAEEIAFTRNASEGLQICQFGFDLKRGDEVLTTTQDYGRMLTTFKQREQRDGIVLKEFSIPVPDEDPEGIVRLFEENVTPKTRLILMCHMINLTGQILPVKGVVHMARKRDIPVIVDGAHTFGHFDFTHTDLDCDYYATSLHKWLLAPHGTGMLYVRKDKIGGLWPLMAAPDKLDDDIRKFEEIGTHPAANYLAIADALTFHQGIGAKRKEERLRYLRDYWAEALLRHDRIRLHTSLKPEFSCCIGTVEMIGVESDLLGAWLWKEYKIIVTPILHDEFQGLRVTANLFTTLEELDRFVEAVESVLKDGIPEAFRTSFQVQKELADREKAG